LAATATSNTQVNLLWNPSATATEYEVLRGNTTITTTASTSFNDTTATAGATFVYKVRAKDASARYSPYSAPDAATTVFFTDDPIVSGTTTAKAVHITELRTAANAMRTAAALGTASFTDPSPSGVLIKAVHIQELRTAIEAARVALGLSPSTFTDPALTTGTTLKAPHVQELRGAVK
jgi:hypothetical protein